MLLKLFESVEKGDNFPINFAQLCRLGGGYMRGNCALLCKFELPEMLHKYGF